MLAASFRLTASLVLLVAGYWLALPPARADGARVVSVVDVASLQIASRDRYEAGDGAELVALGLARLELHVGRLDAARDLSRGAPPTPPTPAHRRAGQRAVRATVHDIAGDYGYRPES